MSRPSFFDYCQLMFIQRQTTMDLHFYAASLRQLALRDGHSDPLVNVPTMPVKVKDLAHFTYCVNLLSDPNDPDNLKAAFAGGPFAVYAVFNKIYDRQHLTTISIQWACMAGWFDFLKSFVDAPDFDRHCAVYIMYVNDEIYDWISERIFPIVPGHFLQGAIGSLFPSDSPYLLDRYMACSYLDPPMSQETLNLHLERIAGNGSGHYKICKRLIEHYGAKITHQAVQSAICNGDPDLIKIMTSRYHPEFLIGPIKHYAMLNCSLELFSSLYPNADDLTEYHTLQLMKVLASIPLDEFIKRIQLINPEHYRQIYRIAFSYSQFDIIKYLYENQQFHPVIKHLTLDDHSYSPTAPSLNLEMFKYVFQLGEYAGVNPGLTPLVITRDFAARALQFSTEVAIYVIDTLSEQVSYNLMPSAISFRKINIVRHLSNKYRYTDEENRRYFIFSAELRWIEGMKHFLDGVGIENPELINFAVFAYDHFAHNPELYNYIHSSGRYAPSRPLPANHWRKAIKESLTKVGFVLHRPFGVTAMNEPHLNAVPYFMYPLLVNNGHFRVRENDDVARFIAIMDKLPLELQATLAHRVVNQTETVIPTRVINTFLMDNYASLWL